MAPDGRSGSFSVLTHAVAGGPKWLTGAAAQHAAAAIGERLQGFDLALVQEDYTVHEALRAATDHPYASNVGGLRRRLFADGLARFSQLPFVPVTRQPWTRCHGLWNAGRDCLASKGFSRAETRLTEDAVVHVYNFALDTGTTAEDHAARAAQLSQLTDALDRYSAGTAIIAAGDTALAPDSPEDARLLARFLETNGLRDACDALLCDSPSRARVLYRAGDGVSLAPVHWERAEELQGPSGRDAVAARFRWHLDEPGQRAAVLIR